MSKSGTISRYPSLLILIGILILGFALRVINLSSNPPAIHADEADTVYTAYSLLKTGKDPYGVAWPIHFQAQSGVYRAPLYTYSTILPVAFFGLNEFSARINSVIFGMVFILLIYKLIDYYSGSKQTALIGAFVASVNPWLIHISRTGLEIQMSLTLVGLGILFFHAAMQKTNKLFIILSALFFGLSIHTYNAPKVFVPFIIMIFFWYHFNGIMKKKIWIVVFVTIFGLLYSVMGYLSIFKKGATEFHRVGIFDNSVATQVVNSERTQTNAPLSLSSVFSNKPLFFLREFSSKFVGPLSPNYLFLNGESSLDKGIGNYGQFHLYEIIPFFVGVYIIFRSNRKLFIFLLFWLLTSLVPGGITKSGYYSYRDVNMVPVMIVLISVGVIGLLEYCRKNINLSIKQLSGIGFIICLPVFIYYLYQYNYAYPYFSRDWWGWNQREALSYARNEKTKYDSILIHGGSDWDILYAFYTKTPPSEFQKAHIIKNQNASKLFGIHNYQIGEILKDSVLQSPDSMYRGERLLLIVPGDLLKDKKPIKNFYGIDGVHVELKAYSVRKVKELMVIIQDEVYE